MSKVKESARFIAEHSENVTVNADQCRKVAHDVYHKMQTEKRSMAAWSSHPLNPNSADPQTIDWIFTVDCLNFSFWGDRKFTVLYKDKLWTGYWSMVAAIDRALDEGIPITTPTFWCSDDFTLDLVAHVFRSENGEPIPLFTERYRVLREAGEALQAAGFTTFADVLAVTHHSALELVNWVASRISSFNDAPVYRGRQVFIYKRAQILVADIWACFEGEGPGQFDDISEITMFADYRVPQILFVLGCIHYSPALMEKIAKHRMLEPGSPDEIEIRGCSIEAVQLIAQEITRTHPESSCNAVTVDFYLWDTAKEEEEKHATVVECHRTRSVYY